MAPHEWLKGAEFGAFIGAILVGTRILTCPLGIPLHAVDAHPAGYEIVMFTMQGAILAVWR